MHLWGRRMFLVLNKHVVIYSEATSCPPDKGKCTSRVTPWGISGQRSVKEWLVRTKQELSSVSGAVRPTALSHERDRTWALCSGCMKSTVGYQDHKSIQPQGGQLSAETQESYQAGISKADTEVRCLGTTYQEHTNRGTLESCRSQEQKAENRNTAVETGCGCVHHHSVWVSSSSGNRVIKGAAAPARAWQSITALQVCTKG